LEGLARTDTNLNGMERWGYIVVSPDPADNRPKPPRRDWVIRATAAGLKACEVWRPLFGEIERPWQERFGKDAIDGLRKAPAALVSRFDVELPDCLPILGYGLFSAGPESPARQESGRYGAGGFSLPALLSKVLLAFAIEFERESDLSLAIGANVLRVLNEKGIRVRDLPFLTGVSKEAISMAMGVLQKEEVAEVGPDQPEGRVQVVRLTPKGLATQGGYQRLLRAIEGRWQVTFGAEFIRTLRELLEGLVGERTAPLSPLFRGLKPCTGGWRASVRTPDTLPHYPMVVHRGGFPDGS
jgi:DNA-binding MarR family transcriptional regulator